MTVKECLASEKQIQRTIVEMLHIYGRIGRLNCIWFHVPNERLDGSSPSGKKYTASLMRVGMIPGAPDLVFVSQNGAVLIEVKSGFGKLSKVQGMFQAWCHRCNVKYHIARSSNDVERILISEGMLIES